MLFPPRRIDEPRDLRVVAALEAVGAGRSTVQLPTMSPSFRDELRAQLVAVAPRLVEEGVAPGTETTPRRATAASADRARSGRAAAADAPPRRAIRTRPMTVLVAGAAVVVLGLGGATWLARGALPGDALYGLKRTAEGVDVSLSGSDLDKGHALLVDAQTRVQEVDALLGRPQSLSFGTGPAAGGAISAGTVQLIVSTLKAADTDTQKGVTLVGDDAINRGAHDGLDLVVAWAQGQQARIDALVKRIPSGSAHDQAVTSANEIRTALQRATALQKDYTDKTCRRGRDAFGQTPCLTPSATGTAPATAPSTAPGTGATASNPGGASSAPTARVTPSAATAPASASTRTSSTPTPRGSGAPAADATSKAPIAIDDCGVQVSLPVVGVSLGTCTPGR